MQSWEELTVEKLTLSLDKVRKVIINGLDQSFEIFVFHIQMRFMK